MKKYLPKIILSVAPVVISLMYLIRGFALYFSTTTYNDIVIEPQRINISFYDILSKENTLVLPKVLAIISLVILLGAVVMLVLSYLIKNKEILFRKIYVISIIASLAILPISMLTRFNVIKSGAATTVVWFDFLTLPYALVLAYSIVLVYFIFKTKKD